MPSFLLYPVSDRYPYGRHSITDRIETLRKEIDTIQDLQQKCTRHRSRTRQTKMSFITTKWYCSISV